MNPGLQALLDPADDVTDEQIGLVLKQGTAAAVASLFVASLYVAVVWTVIDHSSLLTWWVALNVLGVCRIFLHRHRVREEQRSRVGTYWKRVVLVGGALAGLAWGYAATALFPLDHGDRVLVATVLLLGMPAGAVSSYGSWLPSYVAYVLGAVGPFAIMMFARGGLPFTIAGVGCIVFTGFLLREGWAHASTIRRNITQRVELERLSRSLEEARDAALTASRAKSSFLANISHELRTPLTAVIGMSDILFGKVNGAEPRRMTAIIRQSALSLLALINDVLELSRIEAGRLDLRHERFDLPALLREVREMFQPEADRRRLGLRMEVPDDIPVWLIGDPVRLRQVLVNLLGNALKFTPAGHVTLRLLVESTSETEVGLRFEVADTGVGLPETARHHLFRSFSQVRQGTEPHPPGSGLGLHICAQLVALMGGQIDFSSRGEGQGSAFWFTLRAARATPPAPAAAEADPPEARPRRRVLIVDDNEVNLMIAATMVESLGCDVVTASSGIEALDRGLHNRFDLVFLDDQMPGLNGCEVARRWRAHEGSSAHTPLVALTANAMEGDRERYLAAGMDDFLPKPFTAEDLRGALLRNTPSGVPPAGVD